MIFYFLFVLFLIGFVFMVVFMEMLYVVKGKEIYKKMLKFWGYIFFINFVVGVVIGII